MLFCKKNNPVDLKENWSKKVKLGSSWQFWNVVETSLCEIDGILEGLNFIDLQKQLYIYLTHLFLNAGLHSHTNMTWIILAYPWLMFIRSPKYVPCWQDWTSMMVLAVGRFLLHCHSGSGSTIRTSLHGKINPKDWQVASPLVMQGVSKFLGLFQVIMANPVGWSWGMSTHFHREGMFLWLVGSSWSRSAACNMFFVDLDI